jgi:hypothetical protein
MRKINSIFIHHSASDWGDAKLIDSWHKQQGWQSIGYHFVVLNGYRTSENFKEGKVNKEIIGLIEKGRNIESVGSHVLGHNTGSIGICLIHDKQPYTEKQLESYRHFAAMLAKLYNVKVENIKGHYEADKNKPLCPGLDMNKEREIIREMLQ